MRFVLMRIGSERRRMFIKCILIQSKLELCNDSSPLSDSFNVYSS